MAVIETYYDAVPRTAARAESVGPFTLFVNEGPGWSYYARPTLGATTFSAEDVLRVRERQRNLGVPEALEWVAGTTPGLRPAAEAAGFELHEHPLQVLDSARRSYAPSPIGALVRLVSAEEDLALPGAVAAVAFSSPGTAVGTEGTAQLKAAASRLSADLLAFQRERLRSGWTVLAAAFVDGLPVAVGSHQPVGKVSEIVGVGTLPAFRRRGIASAVTSLSGDGLPVRGRCRGGADLRAPRLPPD